MKGFLLLFLCLGCISLANAQLPNDSLENRIRSDSIKTGELHLNIYNFNFLRNYEFFNKIQDGYTLFGTLLTPQLVYYAHPKLAVTAGVTLRKDFGNDGIYKTYPLFSVRYQNKNTSFIFGSLESNIHHRLIDPLFDFERKITNPIEYGTQLIIDKPTIFFDAFINWNRMIYKASSEQEQIYAGISSDISLLKTDKAKLSIPIQLTVFHQGGQIDIVPSALKTLVNSAFGLKLQFPSQGFVKNIFTENYYVSFSDMSPSKKQPYSSGQALYLNAGIDSHYGFLEVAYWNGTGFISPTGMPIYQSVSQQIDHVGFTQNHRQIVFLRYLYQKKLISDLYLDFRVEPLMDLNPVNGTKKMEFFNSLFFVYKHSFKLKKIN